MRAFTLLAGHSVREVGNFDALAQAELAMLTNPNNPDGRLFARSDLIALDGKLPLNTSGGQLSGGRLHGMGFLHEACVQLWGEGGDRQATRTPEVVAVGVGGGPVAGSMLVSSR